MLKKIIFLLQLVLICVLIHAAIVRCEPKPYDGNIQKDSLDELAIEQRGLLKIIANLLAN